MKPTSVSDRQTSRSRATNVSRRTWTTRGAPVVVGDAERHRRPDESVELGRGALGDLHRDVDVGPERAVVAVILGRADRDDHRAAAAVEVLLHLEIRHLGHEDRAGIRSSFRRA